MKKLFRLLLTVLVIMNMVCLISCDRSPTDTNSANSTVPSTATTDPASEEEPFIYIGLPNLVKFRSLSEIAATIDRINRLEEYQGDDGYDRSVWYGGYEGIYLPYMSVASSKDAALEWFDRLSDRMIPKTSEESPFFLEYIEVEYDTIEDIFLSMMFSASDGSSFFISIWQSVLDNNEKYIVANDRVAATLVVGGQEVQFEKKEKSEQLRGRLYLDEGTTMNIYCDPDVIDRLQTEIDTGRLQFICFEDVLDGYYRTSFASLEELRELSVAANGSDDDWNAYLSEHPLDGVQTKEDARKLLQTANELDTVCYDDLSLREVVWYYTDSDVFEIEIHYETPGGTLVTRSPSPDGLYTVDESNPTESLTILEVANLPDEVIDLIGIRDREITVLYDEERELAHTMHRSERNDVQIFFPYADVEFVKYECIATVTTMEAFLEKE